MKLNSSYSEVQLCEYMINNMSKNSLKELIFDNDSIKINHGAFDRKKLEYKKLNGMVISLSKLNKKLRESIINIWEEKSNIVYDNSKIDSIKEAKRYIKKDFIEMDVLLLAIALWKKESSKLNEYGDELFSDYILNKCETKKGCEEIIMSDSNKTLSMNLTECINEVSKYEARIKECEEKLKAKDEMIKELKEQLKLTSDFKNLKKEITKLGKNIDENACKSKSSINDTMQIIDTLKTNLIDIKKDINKQSAMIDTNNKVLANEMKKVIKDLQNTITNKVVDNNRKLADEMNEFIIQQLNEIKQEGIIRGNLAEKEMKEEIKMQDYTKYMDENKTGVQEFPSELDDLLDGAI